MSSSQQSRYFTSFQETSILFRTYSRHQNSSDSSICSSLESCLLDMTYCLVTSGAGIGFSESLEDGRVIRLNLTNRLKTECQLECCSKRPSYLAVAPGSMRWLIESASNSVAINQPAIKNVLQIVTCCARTSIAESFKRLI